MTDMAKVFWTGRSQAVRLPKAYRFEGQEVRISRRDDGSVVLEPLLLDRPLTDAAIGKAAADRIDALRAIVAEGEESGPAVPLDMAEIKRAARAGFDPEA